MREGNTENGGVTGAGCRGATRAVFTGPAVLQNEEESSVSFTKGHDGLFFADEDNLRDLRDLLFKAIPLQAGSGSQPQEREDRFGTEESGFSVSVELRNA